MRQVIVGALLACGCAAATPGPATDSPAAEAAGPPITQELLVPGGYGTLKQDEVTVSLRSGPLLVKVTPLDEAVIRLLAPDTYNRLHALAESRRAEAARSTSGPPTLFLVSFFSYHQDVVFQPEDLQLTHRGRLMQAAAILPITNGFGRQRLAQQENQSAIYAFDERVDYDQPIVVRYAFEQSDAWTRIIPKLEVERARIRARSR